MSSYLRKMVSMGVYSPTNSNQNLGYCGYFFQETKTTYVRIFVDWTLLAPYDGSVNPASDTRTLKGATSGFMIKQYVEGLDAQIKYARQLGLKVVLVFYQFPAWATGRQDTDPFYAFYPPRDVGIGNPWATYLYYVMARWSSLNPNNNGAYADFVEICNEPNLQFRRDAQNPAEAHIVTGRMITTAQSIQRQTGLTSPVLVAPATSDVDPGTNPPNPVAVGPEQFTSDLIGYLRTVSFAADKYFAWSQHNYRDIVGGTNTRAQRTRSALKGWWTGWPRQDASLPYVLLTEGGVPVPTYGETGQSNLLRAAYVARSQRIRSRSSRHRRWSWAGQLHQLPHVHVVRHQRHRAANRARTTDRTRGASSFAGFCAPGLRDVDEPGLALRPHLQSQAGVLTA